MAALRRCDLPWVPRSMLALREHGSHRVLAPSGALVVMATRSGSVLHEWLADPRADSEVVVAGYRQFLVQESIRWIQFRSDDPVLLALALSGRDPAEALLQSVWMVPRVCLPRGDDGLPFAEVEEGRRHRDAADCLAEHPGVIPVAEVAAEDRAERERRGWLTVLQVRRIPR